jgi:arsenical pump membrane protein
MGGCVCIVVCPLFAVGLPPAWVASSAAVVLLLALLVRTPTTLRRLSVPWAMALGVAVLFVAVDLALRHGLQPALSTLAGEGSAPGSLARVALTGALAANVVNNLPAYAALESVTAHDPARLMALLVGVNVAPLVSPWASLATVLWAQRCRARGIRIPAKSLALQGLACAAVSAGLALAALVAVS